MTDNAKSATSSLTKNLPTDRLAEQAQDLLSALAERALGQVTDKLSDATDRLTDYAENGGSSLTGALTGASSLASGKSGLRSMLDAGVAQAKEKVKDVMPGNGGGGGGGSDKGKKIKVTNIVESIEVGVPVSVAYNQWTAFEDYPTFMKKVENVKQESETELQWKAQVFLSHRSWKSTVIEQVPDERIVWESTGDKGRVNGTVTFHELTPDLTKILLVLAYYPQGFFERTGNLWRAQGRRARLELKHFQRHVMTETILDQDEIRGWRGEVADGEVVRSDEEVREEEGQDQSDAAGDEEGQENEDAYEDEDAVDEDEEAADDDEESEEDAYEDEDEDEVADEDGDEEADDEEAEDEEPEEDEEDKGRRGRTRSRSGTKTRARGR